MVIALTLEKRQRMGWRYAEQQRKRFIENTTNTIGRSLLSTFYNSLRSELIKEEQIYVTFYHCLIDNKKIVNEKEIANRGIPDLLLARDVIITKYFILEISLYHRNNQTSSLVRRNPWFTVDFRFSIWIAFKHTIARTLVVSFIL